ncbi:MAG: PQQ-binding-like beta-propeller repeat protein [Gemmataceae bacterium]
MLGFCLLLLVAADPLADTWPSFRGDGTNVTAAKGLPQTWGPSENIAYRTPLPGYGQSSPVVWDQRIFLTAIDGPQKETLHVVAVDAPSGKIVWTKSFEASQKGKNISVMSRAAPTPVVDAKRLIAFFESGDLIALDHDGKQLWKRSLSSEYGAFKNNHGLASSPAQSDDTVFVLIDDTAAAYLLAIDKATGKNRWKVERKPRASWTSPLVTRQGDKTLVVVSSNGSVTVYDAADGKQLANLDEVVGNNIPSATVSGDLIIVGASLNRMKPEPEVSARWNCALRLTLDGTKGQLTTLWPGKKAICYQASPVVNGEEVYFVTPAGIVHCVDRASGEERYSVRLAEVCWATPIAAGDAVYFFGKSGITTVLKAGPKLEKLATNRLWTAEDAAKRFEAAKAKALKEMPPMPKEESKDGASKDGEEKGPRVTPAERQAAMLSAVGDVVYGVAVAQRTFYVRTGTELIAIRTTAVK